MSSNIIIWINENIRDTMVKSIHDYFIFKAQKSQDIDLIINATNGTMNHAEKIMDILSIYKKENPEIKIRAYVYKEASNVATLLALFADELYMSSYAFLGALEPTKNFNVKYNSYTLTQKTHMLLEKVDEISEELLLNKILLETELKYLKERLKDKLNENPKYKKNSQKIVNLFINKPFNPDEIYSKSVLEEQGLPIEGDIPENIMVLIKKLKDNYMKDWEDGNYDIGNIDELKERWFKYDSLIYEDSLLNEIIEESIPEILDSDKNNIESELVEDCNINQNSNNNINEHYLKNTTTIEPNIYDNYDIYSNKGSNYYKYFYYASVIIGGILIADYNWKKI